MSIETEGEADRDAAVSDERWQAANASQGSLHTDLTPSQGTSHYASLYESHVEQLTAALEFVRLGLERDERCLYIAADHTPAEITRELHALNADVDRALDEGQLRITSAADTYLQNGFDPDRMLDQLLDMAEESVAEGYEGLRVTGEMCWMLEADVDYGAVLEYEAKYQQIAPDHDIVALCQYDVTRFDAEAVVDVIQTHPKVIYRGQVCENPYYMPPQEFLGTDKPELEAQRMLQTLQDLTSARSAIQHREQRLEVFNRVLRHDLRNQMNVIRAHANQIARKADEDCLQANAKQIVTTADDLIDITEDVRRVEQILTEGAVTCQQLQTVINGAADEVRRSGSEISVESAFEPGVEIKASRELATAFAELLRVIAAESETVPTVAFDVVSVASSALTDHVIEINVSEGSLPVGDIETIIRGEETPLHHPDGLNLWVFEWIVTHSGGDIQFTCEDSCADLVIVLPTAKGTGTDCSSE